MRLTQAGAGSVYIPLTNEMDNSASGLIFCSIQPVTEQTTKLKKKIIPLESLAGRCFKTGSAFAVANSKSGTDHYAKADEVSGYRTQDTLNVPLRVQGKVVGVLQRLNRRNAPFTEPELPGIEQLASLLASKTDEFLRTPGYLKVLGFVPNREAEYGTVMFCDLIASSTLFQELNVSAAIQHINDYLECLCNVAFVHGAIVDKYMGDGVLLRFDGPDVSERRTMAAVRAALEMQNAFDQIKKGWIVMSDPLAALYTRTGIAYGPVQKAVVGHPQYQYLTVFGTPVNAINLCEGARRDQNVIVIDKMLYQNLGDNIEGVRIAGNDLGKAQRYTPWAYEVQGLKSIPRVRRSGR